MIKFFSFCFEIYSPLPTDDFETFKIMQNLKMVSIQLKKIYNLVAIVSSVALVYFGQFILGSITLAWLIKGVFQRKWVPSPLNKAIESIGFVGTNISRIAFGNFLIKIITIISITFMFLEYIKNYLCPYQFEEKFMIIIG